MRENKFYFWAIIIGVIVLITALIYFIFFKEASVGNKNSGSQYSGGSTGFNFKSGGTVNVLNKNTQVNQVTHQNQTLGKDGVASKNQAGNVNNFNNSVRSSSSTFMNVNENQTNLLVERKGDTLAFASTSPDGARSMGNLDIPGYASGNYTPSRKIKPDYKQKVCLVIFTQLNTEREKILSMEIEKQYSYILDKLRYITSFGGLEYQEQKNIIESILKDFKANKTLDGEAYCKKIQNSTKPTNLMYEQCLMVVEDIILNNISNTAEIKKRLLTIPMFKMIKSEDMEKVINMVSEGIKSGNLSKEKICSLITSLIIGALEGTAIFQICLDVMTKISALSSLNASIVEAHLNKIPGFSSLDKELKKKLINNILEDKKLNGTIDAVTHCANITAAIIAFIEGTLAYQMCIKSIDKIINGNIESPSEIAKILLEIPGFNILSDELQKKVVDSILEAIKKGTLAAEKEEICRNITALILDSMQGNQLFQQCYKIVEGIATSTKAKDRKYIESELNKIPNFSQLLAEDKEVIISMIVAIDLDKNLNQQITNICLLLVSKITDFLINSQAYQQCIKTIDEIISEKLTLEADIRKKFNSINGFLLLPKTEQDKFITKIINAIKDGTLEEKKKAICLEFASMIENELSKNEMYQMCIAVVNGIFRDNKSQNEQHVYQQLLTMSFFKAFNAETQKQYVQLILNMGPPDLVNKIKDYCMQMAQDGANISELLQCVQTIATIVSDKKQTTRDYVRTQMEFVKTFQSKKENERVEMINQISAIPFQSASAGDNSKKCNADMFAIPNDILSIASQVPLKLNELENFALLSTNERTSYSELLIQERRKCISMTCNSSLNVSANKIYSLCVDLDNLIKSKAKDTYLNNVLKDAVKICSKPNKDVSTNPNDKDPNASIIDQQCVALAFSIVSEQKQTMKDYVKTKMETIQSFKLSSADKKVKIVDDISKVPNITTIKTEILPDILLKCNSEMKVISENLASASTTVPLMLNSIPEFRTLNANAKSEQITLGIMVSKTGKTNPGSIAKYCLNLQTALKSFIISDNSEEIKNTLGAICRPISTSTSTSITPTNPNSLEIVKPKPPFETNFNPFVKPNTVNPTSDTTYATASGLPTGVTNNANAGQIGQGNIMTFGSDNYGKCAILNKIVFDSYNEYLNAINLHNLPITADSKIQEINDKLADGEYYIPNHYIAPVEQGLADDFENIINNQSPDSAKHNTVANTLYSSFTADGNSVTELLPSRAKATLISRLYRSKDYLITNGIQDEMISNYIIEIGKCTNPKKDVDFWKIASMNMQYAMQGIQESVQNFSQNAGLGMSDANAEIYEKCSGLMATTLKNPTVTLAVIETQMKTLPGSGLLDTNVLSSYAREFLGIVSEENPAVKQESINRVCRGMGEKLVKAKNDIKSIPPLSQVSKCYVPAVDKFPSNETYKEFAQLNETTQRIIANKAWMLILNFNESAKEKRAQIVRTIWEATAASFVANKKQPVAPIVCEQAANDAWGSYNEDDLKNTLEGPLDELLQSLEGMLTDFESGEQMKYFTNPPTERCKCHMEKIHSALSNARVSDYTSCRSANDINKNIALVKANTSKYLNSKTAQLALQANLGAGDPGKDLCSIMFQSIEDMADDINEANKFVNNATENAVTLNQICVQQLRGIYTTISTFKQEYFKLGEIEKFRDARTCDIFKD